MSDDRPPVYEEDGRVIYRASAIGGCTKMLAAIRMGYSMSDTPERMREVFEAGNEAESRTIIELKNKGWEIGHQQEQVELQLTPRLVVRAHLDARAIDTPIEIKSTVGEISDALWERYLWQFSVIMCATGKDLILVTWDRDERRITKTEIFKDLPLSRAQILQKVLEVERVAGLGVLPEVCDHPMYPCPVFRLHEDQLPLPLQIDDEEVDRYAREYDHARKEETRWKGIKDAARRALRLGIVEDNIRTRSGIRVKFIQAKSRRVSEKLMKDRGWDPEEVKEETIQERIDVRVDDAESTD